MSIVKFKVTLAWTRVHQSGRHGLGHGQEPEETVCANVTSIYPHISGKKSNKRSTVSLYKMNSHS